MDESPTYARRQFVYKTDTHNIANYFWLGLATAGLITLGVAHVLMGCVMVAFERLGKHVAVPLVSDEWSDKPGVSAVVNAFAGYLVATGLARNNYSVVAIGLLASVGYVRDGLDSWNLFAHALPFALGALIAFLTRFFL